MSPKNNLYIYDILNIKLFWENEVTKLNSREFATFIFFLIHK